MEIMHTGMESNGLQMAKSYWLFVSIPGWHTSQACCCCEDVSNQDKIEKAVEFRECWIVMGNMWMMGFGATECHLNGIDWARLMLSSLYSWSPRNKAWEYNQYFVLAILTIAISGQASRTSDIEWLGFAWTGYYMTDMIQNRSFLYTNTCVWYISSPPTIGDQCMFALDHA
jgi:hypothetical protein